MSLVSPSSLVTVHSLRWLTHLCERSTINLVNSQIGNHLEYKSRSTYESNNIDWALLNVDTFLIKVEILWLHIKLICKLERIGGSILYVEKRSVHWIPFIYDLRMLWSPVQNFESALGITHAPTRSLSISSRGPEIVERGLGWVQYVRFAYEHTIYSVWSPQTPPHGSFLS